jgi:uncharacterized membrane protein (UPF0127 family)
MSQYLKGLVLHLNLRGDVLIFGMFDMRRPKTNLEFFLKVAQTPCSSRNGVYFLQELAAGMVFEVGNQGLSSNVLSKTAGITGKMLTYSIRHRAQYTRHVHPNKPKSISSNSKKQ